MSTLAFRTHDRNKIATQVEEKLRSEIGASTPIPYTIEDGDPHSTSRGALMGELYRTAFGGRSSPNLLFTISFNIEQPRPANLRVQVNKQGIGSYAGSLLYSTTLPRPLTEQIQLEDSKAPRFTGDTEESAKLNANSDLIKRVLKFTRTRSQAGAVTFTIPRYCVLAPDGTQSILVINTLQRPTSFGFSASLDAKEFLDIATLIEATL